MSEQNSIAKGEPTTMAETTEGVYEDTPDAAAKRREKALAEAAAKETKAQEGK